MAIVLKRVFRKILECTCLSPAFGLLSVEALMDNSPNESNQALCDLIDHRSRVICRAPVETMLRYQRQRPRRLGARLISKVAGLVRWPSQFAESNCADIPHHGAMAKGPRSHMRTEPATARCGRGSVTRRAREPAMPARHHENGGCHEKEARDLSRQ